MNIYMYPISDPNKSTTKNPYMDNLINTIENDNCIIVNKGKINKFGVLDLLVYIPKVDVYYLNWIENLPDRRFGWIQAIIFFIIFLVLKIFKKKIIWMMHNKLSHSKKSLFFKVLTNYLLINHADIILTHSLEGVRFGKTLMKENKKIEFIHLPIENNIGKISHKTDKDIDILIWGSISPYKGIDTFLEYLKDNEIYREINIHIVGKITDTKLEEKLKSYENKNIIIENNFISSERLEELLSRTKIVLFTYAGYSTLSSAALIDTLSYGNYVIGPDVGAFRDLREEGIIDTFINFEDLLQQIERGIFNQNSNNQKLANFIEKNTWSKFGNWLCEIIAPNNNVHS